MSVRAACAAVVAGAALLAGAASAGRFVPTRDPDFPRVRYADSTTSVNDRCIMTGWKLSIRMTPTYVNGLPVGYCCRGCPAEFRKNPEKALLEQHLSFRDPVEPHREVPLDPRLHLWMNWDLVTFASLENLLRYRQDPWRWTTALTDPVSERRFHPAAGSPTATYAGRTWWFPDSSSRARFLEQPEHYYVQRDFHRE